MHSDIDEYTKKKKINMYDIRSHHSQFIGIIIDENSSLTSTVNTLEEQNNSLTNTVKTLEEQNKNLTNTVKTLEEQNNNLTNNVRKLEIDNDNLTDNVKMLEDEISELKNDLIETLKYYNKAAIDTNKTTTETVNIMAQTQAISNQSALSVINFLNKYHSDAPSLERTTRSMVTDMIIYNDRGMKYQDFYDKSTSDEEMSQDEKDEQVATILIKKFKADKFEKFVVDGILWFYKKEDPKDQSLWATDTSRMIFLVKMLSSVDKTQISKWITDKNGNELKNYIIEPILDNIKNIFSKYHDICINQLNNPSLSNAKVNKIRKNQEYLGKMLYLITDKSFPKKLLSNLISEFDIKKNPKIDIKNKKMLTAK